MKTLTLPLKKKWFDMIKAGIKKEEYRECSSYWINRFQKLCSEFEFVFLGHPGMLDERKKMISAGGLKCDTLEFAISYPKRTEFYWFRSDEGVAPYGGVGNPTTR